MLIIKVDMTPESFLWKIGNNCKEYAEKFETLEEVIKSTRVKKNDKTFLISFIYDYNKFSYDKI